MKILILFTIILNLLLANDCIWAASGVSNSTRSKVEGTMKKTTSSIKESNLKLKEELLSKEVQYQSDNKKLEDYKNSFTQNQNKSKYKSD